MKKLKYLILSFFIGFAVACNFTEEIYVNQDGSGELSISFDGSELMNQIPTDDIMKPDEKAIDTLLVFKELLKEKKDSIAQLPIEEQEKLKKLEPFSMRMIMNSENKEMMFKMFSEFQNINEVNDAFNAFQDAASVSKPTTGKSANTPSMNTAEPGTKVDYKFANNIFSRTTTITNQELFKKSVDSLASAEMFLSGSTYTFKYHFPRKVKKVNVEGATFSIDGKTMIYEVNFLDIMKTPESLNLQVELEE